MLVDVAPQQQLTEVFTTSRSHHRSSSTSSLSLSHRRSPTTSDELGKKAEQILGHATITVESLRCKHLDFNPQHPLRLNITASSRSNTSSMASLTTVNNPSITTSLSENTTINFQSSNRKNKQLTMIDCLVPLILQLVATPKFTKLPEKISKIRSNSKPIENVQENRQTTILTHSENVQLSDDENEEDDHDNVNLTDTVLTEITDNKTNNNSNENQTEVQHSGIINSRFQQDEDSEDEDSDNQEATHSDAENDDETNKTYSHAFSLMDFVLGTETHSKPFDSSIKHSSESLPNINKRSISPEIKRDNDKSVHNSEDHQNKRKKLLIKRALLKSFVSSVNTKINFKRPSLPITIPTHLFLDQSLSNDDQQIERSQRTSKRYANGLFKHDTNTDVNENLSQISTYSLNNHINLINDTNQKKTKSSHLQEKSLYKQEPLISTSTTILKNDQTINSSNETDSKTRSTLLTTTVQPKKEKSLAIVKPLQQSTSVDNSSSINSINNGIKLPDSLTTTNSRQMLPSTKSNYTKIKNMTKTDLDSLARKKKKEADSGKRTTFIEVRSAMGLYLESVCYFVQCANEETKSDQRISLLTSTLAMLQQLARNHQKMFPLSNQSSDLSSLQQKFLLINYWLQSFIYHLQLNTHMPTIERYANQVTEYFTQLKNPSTRTTNVNIQQQSTPINDNNPISPLSTTSQTSSSDLSTTSGNNQTEQNRYIYDFSKLMLNSYYSTYYWNKAENFLREKCLKEFIEQLLKQNQNRRLSRDDTTLDFILYIFNAIELLRLSVA